MQAEREWRLLGMKEPMMPTLLRSMGRTRWELMQVEQKLPELKLPELKLPELKPERKLELKPERKLERKFERKPVERRPLERKLLEQLPRKLLLPSIESEHITIKHCELLLTTA
jgi:hypothetical protein